MKSSLPILCMILLLFPLAGCDINTANKEKEPEIEGFFRAELNGEEWNEKPTNATVLDVYGKCYLDLFSDRHDEAVFPPDTRLSFFTNYEQGKTNYEIVDSQSTSGRNYSALFTESDWDAGYAKYEPIPDPENHWTIFVERDEDGRNIISGNFAVTFVVREKYTDLRYLPYRKYADTVRIRNGEFEAVLDVQVERRNTKTVCGWLIDDSEK